MLGQLLPGVEIHATARTVEMAPHNEPDPSWRFVDEAGHGHFYGTEKDPYPTLAYSHHHDCSYSDHDEDCAGTGYYACSQCGEEIVPGTRYNYGGPEVVGCDYTISHRSGSATSTYVLTEKEYEAAMKATSTAASEAFAAALPADRMTERIFSAW